MSGGHWGYLKYRVQEHADWVHAAIYMLGEMEQIVDRAICGDDDEQEAKDELYGLVVDFFDRHGFAIGR